MNSPLSYTTVEPHRDDLNRRAACTRSSGESRYAPWVRTASLNIALPRLRTAWRRSALALSSLATVAIVALVVTLSSSIAAARLPVRHFTTARHYTTARHFDTAMARQPLGLVRDPHTHLWTCIRVPAGHKVG